MDNTKLNFSNIDEYILLFPEEVQDKLRLIRNVIKEAAPEASEKISWQMPTFYLDGNLVHFAAHSKHIGFYPGADGVECFKERLFGYQTSKGAIQFPFNNPLPCELIQEIVRFRVSENKQLAEQKNNKKTVKKEKDNEKER